MVGNIFRKLKSLQDLPREKRNYLLSIGLDLSGLTWKAGKLSRGGKAIYTGKLNHLSASPIEAIVALDHSNRVL